MKHFSLHNLFFSSALCLSILAFGTEDSSTPAPETPRRRPPQTEAVDRGPNHPEREKAHGGKREKKENGMHRGEKLRRHPGQGIQKILEELKEKNPAEYRRLQELRQTDSKKFFQEMRQYMPRRVPREFQQILQKEDECRKLAEKIREMPEGPERQKLEGELKQKLQEQYEETIQKMEQRLAQMQSNLSDLKARKEIILSRKFEKLLQENQEKKGPPSPGNREKHPIKGNPEP